MTKRGPWPSPSDRLKALIREHNKRGERPEDFPGRSDEPPLDGQDFEIVGTYDVRGKKGEVKKKVRCVHSHLHYDGRYLWCADGYLRLVGHGCALTKYRGQYEEADRKWRQQERARQRREEFAGTVSLVGPALEEVRCALKSAECFDRTRRRFEQQLRDAFICLDRAVAEKDGALFVTRELTARQRETIKVQADAATQHLPGNRRDIERRAMVRRMEAEASSRRVGHLGPASIIFTDTASPSKRLRAAEQKLSSAADALANGIQNLPDESIDRHVRAARRAGSDALAAHAQLIALEYLLTSRLLPVVVSLLNRTADALRQFDRYEVQPRGLLGHNHDGASCGVALPKDYFPGQFESVQRLHDYFARTREEQIS